MNCITEAWASHEAELRGYLTRQTSDARLAEDLLQDTFVKAIAEGAGFCHLQNPRAWLFTVARNRLLDHFRLQKNFIELDHDISDEQPEIAAVETLSACLPRALQDLTEDEREVITLCDLEGLNQADYAKQKNISLAGAKSRIQRARKHLKNRLHKNCQVRFDENGNVCCFVPRDGR